MLKRVNTRAEDEYRIAHPFIVFEESGMHEQKVGVGSSSAVHLLYAHPSRTPTQNPKTTNVQPDIYYDSSNAIHRIMDEFYLKSCPMPFLIKSIFKEEWASPKKNVRLVCPCCGHVMPTSMLGSMDGDHVNEN